MQSYNVRLQSEISKSFRCVRAANSLDIDVEKKSIHELQIQADLTGNFNIGLILGSSGSGKTTLAKHIFGENVFKEHLDSQKTLLDQLPNELSYEECASLISGIGLTSVPCWIRPAYTLSNGQKARAEAVLTMCSNDNLSVLDEWTSVVDRTVAKVMSHCLQKFVRKQNKKIILLSCHYDVVEWLNPDWIIDCNQSKFIDRRSLHSNERRRKESLNFDIREIDSSSWKYFSKYHYLSQNLPGGKNYYFGLFDGENQIGFQNFSNYVPHGNKAEKKILHSNRTVIHPDYCGFGLGIKIIDVCSKIMHDRGFRIMAKFSSEPIYKSMMKSKNWTLKRIDRQIGIKTSGGRMVRKTGFRENVKTYSFEFID